MTHYRFAVGVFQDSVHVGFITESLNPFAGRYMVSNSPEFHESAVWSKSLETVNSFKGIIRDQFPDYILKTVEVAVTYRVLEKS